MPFRRLYNLLLPPTTTPGDVWDPPTLSPMTHLVFTAALNVSFNLTALVWGSDHICLDNSTDRAGSKLVSQSTILLDTFPLSEPGRKKPGLRRKLMPCDPSAN